MHSTNTLECLSITCVFHEERCTRKLRLKQKSDFLIKISCIWPLVPLLLLRIADSIAPGGAVPLPSIIFTTVTSCERASFTYFMGFLGQTLVFSYNNRWSKNTA